MLGLEQVLEPGLVLDLVLELGQVQGLEQGLELVLDLVLGQVLGTESHCCRASFLGLMELGPPLFAFCVPAVVKRHIHRSNILARHITLSPPM